MSTLYLTAIQPNPRGKDTSRMRSSARLNDEWVQFEVRAESRDLIGDELFHLTFEQRSCRVTGEDHLARFGSAKLRCGQSVRVHTGSGQSWWEGSVLHTYLGRSWFVWNNGCGDRAVLRYDGKTIDWAEYRRNPPEGVLRRVPGTNTFE